MVAYKDYQWMMELVEEMIEKSCNRSARNHESQSRGEYYRLQKAVAALHDVRGDPTLHRRGYFLP